MHKFLTILGSAVLLSGAVSAQNLLANPNFDDGSGLGGWTGFGNQFSELTNPPLIDPHSGDTLCKMFGSFSGSFNVSGIFQEFPAAQGDIFKLKAWSRNASGDPMQGIGAPNSNWCVQKIAFFDAGGNEIGAAEGTILDGNSPQDVWIDNPAVVGTAPAGTDKVQALLLFLQPGFEGGSAQFDTVCFDKLTPVVINELSYDDTGGDDHEFIELYANVTTDISGWTVNGIDGTSTAQNGQVTIPAGTILNAGDFWVISNSAFVTANQSITGIGMENGADGLWLADVNGAVIDGVIWEFSDWTRPVPAWIEGTGVYGAVALHENNFKTSLSRIRDGYDTNVNGCDFWVPQWTPGTSNQLGAIAPPRYTNDFDGAVGDTVENDFLYSFVSGNTVDPAALTIPIPASPQGGNCSSWIDLTGGGDSNWYASTASRDWVVEAYVHLAGIDPVAFDADDGEYWVIGARGTTDSFGEAADVNGYLVHIGCSNDSGQTGIGWVFTRTAVSADLALVDFNDGGGDFTILGSINIVAGQNDGWQRIRLCALGGDVVGNFGGTYGCDDGQRIVASGVSACEGGAYLTYRECVNNNSALNGLTVDALSIAQHATASTGLTGTASATSVGIPTIFATGVPSIPNPGFAINGGNLVPSTLCALTLGFGTTPGTPIPGAPSSAILYISPVATNFGVADGSGNAVFALPIPCISSLSGTPLAGQMIDLDPSLPNPIPIGTSVALTATLGN